MKQPILLKKRGSKEPGKTAKSIQEDLKVKKGSPQFELEDNRPETMAQLKLEAGLDEQKQDRTKDASDPVALEEMIQPMSKDKGEEEVPQPIEEVEIVEALKEDTTQLMAAEEKEELA